MVLLGAGLNGFRIVYLDAIPTDQLPTDAAAVIYDTLVRFIRTNLRAVLVLFLVLAAVAWVSGPDPAPAALRSGTRRGLDAVRHGRDRAGLSTPDPSASSCTPTAARSGGWSSASPSSRTCSPTTRPASPRW